MSHPEKKMDNNFGIGFWGNNDKGLRNIWEQTPEEIEANSRRRLAKESGVATPPASEFDLKTATKGPQSALNPGEFGQIGAQPHQGFGRNAAAEGFPAARNDFGLMEPMNNCELMSPDGTRTSFRRAGCNREDAAAFAERYGIATGTKASLYYRLRKGKYRKEF